MFSIPILTYHKISYNKEFGLTTIKPEIFKSQLEILINHKYFLTTFKQLDVQTADIQQQVILTFDDGYESIYQNAFPVMHELQIKGVIFIISDYISKKNEWESYPVQRKFMHLSRAQIIELHQSGFEIGSHGRRHLFLNNKPDRILKTETEDSKKMIEDIIGDEVISFSYPFGRYNRRVMQFVRQAGYKYALGSANLIRSRKNSQWQLNRRTIYSLDTEKCFLNKISKTKSYYIGFLTEWIIQHGALLNIIRQNLNKY